MSNGRGAGGMEAGLEYALVDVFAERALEGNQLAIFTDARGLTAEQMQALARETNLSETTFILPDDDVERERRDGVRVRIFTTAEELPFAGHPTLGTAAWLYWNHSTLRGAELITLRQNAGPITVRFEAAQGGRAGVSGSGVSAAGVFGTMRQSDPVFGRMHQREVVAGLLGLGAEDLHPALPVETVSTGLPFCIVPVRGVEALGRVALQGAASRAYLAGSDARFFFCVAPAAAGSGADFQNRMQFYNGEDPATGSASGCAISYLVRHGVVASGREAIFVQGVEMGRPSRLWVSASLHGEAVTEVFVSGRTIHVASGRFFLPCAGRFPQAEFTNPQQ